MSTPLRHRAASATGATGPAGAESGPKRRNSDLKLSATAGPAIMGGAVRDSDKTPPRAGAPTAPPSQGSTILTHASPSKSESSRQEDELNDPESITLNRAAVDAAVDDDADDPFNVAPLPPSMLRGYNNSSSRLTAGEVASRRKSSGVHSVASDGASSLQRGRNTSNTSSSAAVAVAAATTAGEPVEILAVASSPMNQGLGQGAWSPSGNALDHPNNTTNGSGGGANDSTEHPPGDFPQEPEDSSQMILSLRRPTGYVRPVPDGPDSGDDVEGASPTGTNSGRNTATSRRLSDLSDTTAPFNPAMRPRRRSSIANMDDFGVGSLLTPSVGGGTGSRRGSGFVTRFRRSSRLRRPSTEVFTGSDLVNATDLLTNDVLLSPHSATTSQQNYANTNGSFFGGSSDLYEQPPMDGAASASPMPVANGRAAVLALRALRATDRNPITAWGVPKSNNGSRRGSSVTTPRAASAPGSSPRHTAGPAANAFAPWASATEAVDPRGVLPPAALSSSSRQSINPTSSSLPGSSSNPANSSSTPAAAAGNEDRLNASGHWSRRSSEATAGASDGHSSFSNGGNRRSSQGSSNPSQRSTSLQQPLPGGTPRSTRNSFIAQSGGAMTRSFGYGPSGPAASGSAHAPPIMIPSSALSAALSPVGAISSASGGHSGAFNRGPSRMLGSFASMLSPDASRNRFSGGTPHASGSPLMLELAQSMMTTRSGANSSCGTEYGYPTEAVLNGEIDPPQPPGFGPGTSQLGVCAVVPGILYLGSRRMVFTAFDPMRFGGRRGSSSSGQSAPTPHPLAPGAGMLSTPHSNFVSRRQSAVNAALNNAAAAASASSGGSTVGGDTASTEPGLPSLYSHTPIGPPQEAMMLRGGMRLDDGSPTLMMAGPPSATETAFMSDDPLTSGTPSRHAAALAEKFYQEGGFLCVAKDLAAQPFPLGCHTNGCFLPLADNSETRLLDHLPAVFTFINENARMGRPVALYCVKGKSRSVSFALAYLMWHWRIESVDVALALLRKAYKEADPNTSFMIQLASLTLGDLDRCAAVMDDVASPLAPERGPPPADAEVDSSPRGIRPIRTGSGHRSGAHAAAGRAGNASGNNNGVGGGSSSPPFRQTSAFSSPGLSSQPSVASPPAGAALEAPEPQRKLGADDASTTPHLSGDAVTAAPSAASVVDAAVAQAESPMAAAAHSTSPRALMSLQLPGATGPSPKKQLPKPPGDGDSAAGSGAASLEASPRAGAAAMAAMSAGSGSVSRSHGLVTGSAVPYNITMTEATPYSGPWSLRDAGGLSAGAAPAAAEEGPSST